MSELINNQQKRRELLKQLIRQLHTGAAPEAVRKQLAVVLGQVPYEDVVAVEQELINEGLPIEEILSLCDIHSAALKGQIDHSGAKPIPAGHPVDVFIQENRALQQQITALNHLFAKIDETKAEALQAVVKAIIDHWQQLLEVDKHYRRKEYLLFPYLEQRGLTGPPTVMWGKHDEARELLKAGREALAEVQPDDTSQLKSVIDLVLKPAIAAVEEMIYKEEQILFPMAMDALEDNDWLEIKQQSADMGFCLLTPTVDWQPQEPPSSPQPVEASPSLREKASPPRIRLETGSFTAAELNAILNTLPFDITFVDKDDIVRYYSAGRERVFERNLLVIGRKVQFCHPPKSMPIVQKILDDFRSGRQNRAPFWINLGGKFIHIEYFALRDENGQYLGTLEVTQDLTQKRQLSGEQRLLSYAQEDAK